MWLPASRPHRAAAWRVAHPLTLSRFPSASLGVIACCTRRLQQRVRLADHAVPRIAFNHDVNGTTRDRAATSSKAASPVRWECKPTISTSWYSTSLVRIPGRRHFNQISDRDFAHSPSSIRSEPLGGQTMK